MAQIRMDAFHREGVIFAMNIEDVLPWKDHIQISRVTIGTVLLRHRRRIHHALNRLSRFVAADDMPQNLTWIPVHHRYDVDVFPGSCSGLVL